MRSSSVDPGRPKEERCSKAVCLAVKAELRRVQAQLKDAQTVFERERSQRATLMAGEIRRIEVERDEALRELDVLRNEHQMALKVRRFAQRLVVQLTDDKRELIDQKAKLAEDLWSTKSELAGQAKEAFSRARSASRDNRERDMQMRRVKEDGRLQGLGEAAAKLEAASAQVKDARDRAQRAEAAAQVTAEKEFARCQASIEAVVEAAKEQLAEAEAATACALCTKLTRHARRLMPRLWPQKLHGQLKMMQRGRGLQASAGLSVTGPKCKRRLNMSLYLPMYAA